MRISGDTLSKKKITVHILDEIDGQIQRYLLVQIATSVLLGVVAWLVFAWTGLDNAVTWGCIGGVLHLIPYAGPAAFVALIALIAYVQFDTIQPVLAIQTAKTALGARGFPKSWTRLLSATRVSMAHPIFVGGGVSFNFAADRQALVAKNTEDLLSCHCEQAGIFGADFAVTLTRPPLEGLAIDDHNLASLILDERARLQLAGR